MGTVGPTLFGDGGALGTHSGPVPHLDCWRCLGLLCSVTRRHVPETKAFTFQFLEPLQEERRWYLRVQNTNIALSPQC